MPSPMLELSVARAESMRQHRLIIEATYGRNIQHLQAWHENVWK